MVQIVLKSCAYTAVVANVVAADSLQPPAAGERTNIRFAYYLGFVWAALAGAFFAWYLGQLGIRYLRKAACLNGADQGAFSRPNRLYALLKRHVLDAPLFRTRHSREIKLGPTINAGTIPTRFQALFMIAYLGTNIGLLVARMDYRYGYFEAAAEFRNRAGVLAAMNMLPLFLIASRNNPLITLLHIPFDTYNLIHRCIGRIVVLLALIHALAWVVPKVHTNGWDAVGEDFRATPFIQNGLIAVTAFVIIFFQSHAILRNAYYEIFLHAHQALVILALAVLWIHLKHLPEQRILYGVIAIWATERAYRLFTLCFRNMGHRWTTAELEALRGDATRVTIRMARPWTFRPGQHVYIYVPALGWWTSHPFSVAWLQEEGSFDPEKGWSLRSESPMGGSKASVSLVVRRRAGFTEKLYDRAYAGLNSKSTHWAIVEGPYGSECFNSYGTILLFAGGVGITHELSHLRELVVGAAKGIIAAKKIVLVWSVQYTEHLDWIQPWLKPILSMQSNRDLLKIILFITRKSSARSSSPNGCLQVLGIGECSPEEKVQDAYPKELTTAEGSYEKENGDAAPKGTALELAARQPTLSPSYVQIKYGKPDVQALVDGEVESQVGAMVVNVCGPGSLCDDVRAAVRRRQTVKKIDFVESNFSW